MAPPDCRENFLFVAPYGACFQSETDRARTTSGIVPEGSHVTTVSTIDGQASRRSSRFRLSAADLVDLYPGC